MQSPYFSRREVLLFLLDHGSNIEAATENACWRAAWAAFSRGLLDPHAGPRLEFQRTRQFYGYSPAVDERGRYTLQNFNIETALAQ